MIPIAPILPIPPITPIPRYAPNAGSRCSGASRKTARRRAVNSGAAAITLIATAYCRLTREESDCYSPTAMMEAPFEV